jgi:hypothetical protein
MMLLLLWEGANAATLVLVLVDQIPTSKTSLLYVYQRILSIYSIAS